MADSLPQQVRNGGSGLTTFYFNNQPIAFARGVQVQAPTPVAAPEAIQPMDAPNPIEILTPQAIGPVQLQVQVFERFQTKIWDQIIDILDSNPPAHDNQSNKLGDVTQYYDLRYVFNRLANITGDGITCQKRITNPSKIGGTSFYADVYHGVKITDIRDDENVDITTLSIVKNISMMATYSTRLYAV